MQYTVPIKYIASNINQRIEKVLYETHLVYGKIASGKTSYSIDLAKDIKAIRFSIDPWMQNVFADDSSGLDFAWVMERVGR